MPIGEILLSVIWARMGIGAVGASALVLRGGG